MLQGGLADVSIMHVLRKKNYIKSNFLLTFIIVVDIAYFLLDISHIFAEYMNGLCDLHCFPLAELAMKLHLR